MSIQLVDNESLRKIREVDHYDPFTVLGLRVLEYNGVKGVVIRSFHPNAKRMWIAPTVAPDERYELNRITTDGFFELFIQQKTEYFPYVLIKELYSGEVVFFHDPYAFLPTLSDYDLYLFNLGDHHRIYEKLGSHCIDVNGISGAQFAVWAPNARSVSVIGDFNGWDARYHQMRVLGSSGVWEIFIPGISEGQLYKFKIKTQDGRILDKTDPYGTEMEFRPRTAARINSLSNYEWHDAEWMERRKQSDHLGEPLAIYEVHLGSWARKPEEGNRWLTYRELAYALVPYIKENGFTHIELLPIMEHPFDGSWGYQVTGYFAPTSRYGSPQDFMFFVDYCHQNNIGVILDWVPAHFPKDSHALGEFDGTHLYEHADPRLGEHQDWGTYVFNYGRHEVRNFLISNALFWLEKYHVDGLRIDAVASMLYLDYSRKEGEWIPNRYGGRENLEAIQLLKDVNKLVHSYYPGVLTIAEESTAWPGVTHSIELGGLGFSLKWNMGWMHDMLEYFSKDPIFRMYHHDLLTFVLLYAFTERFLLPLSHDEVVHGKASLLSKMPGDVWQKFANLRLLFGLMYAFPGKKLLFMGGEFGQWNEWNHDASLDWHLLQYPLHQGLQRWVRDLNKLYKWYAALHQVDFYYTGFEWIDFRDVAHSVISFIRKSADTREQIVIVCNFTPVPRFNYRIGVPESGQYRELINSDSEFYGGSNMGNAGVLFADPVPHHGKPFSLSLTLPPLAVLYIKRETE
ncbi:MAG: 1,4-alpha-glucan branching protein GlgB [Bacteroidetes bacterium]|nr:1,4-alpha-glucan branching protein GlgB [Bacteroidota bacterium]